MTLLLIALGILLSILIFVSKKDRRKAFFAFLTAQSITWPVGLLLVYFEKVEYPVRLFPKAIDSSFLHGYIMNPVVFAIYYIHYPSHAKLVWRLIYTILITAIPISVEILENNYTNLIKYKTWNPYYTWMFGLAAYFTMKKYLDWFFKNTFQ
jgi:hypothetical protein